MAKNEETLGNNKLIGMKEICNHMRGISEATVLKWHRELDMPIKKRGGIWCATKTKLDAWFDEK